MEKSLRGTKTADNLLKAFAGESQARTRYTYYASAAKKEGFVQISNIFMETSENEKEHAKVFFKHLNKDLKGEAVTITADYPVGLGNTKENLSYAVAGEHEEHSKAYPEFARIAEEEGFKEIASSFRNISKVEEHHEARFKKLLNNIENNTVFKKDEVVLWKCNNCGYIHEGIEAPNICPSCNHPKDYFEVFYENY